MPFIKIVEAPPKTHECQQPELYRANVHGGWDRKYGIGTMWECAECRKKFIVTECHIFLEWMPFYDVAGKIKRFFKRYIPL